MNRFPDRKPGRTWLVAAQYLAALVLLCFVLDRINLKSAFEAAISLPIGRLVATVAMAVVTTLVQAFRFHLLAVDRMPGIGFGQNLKAYLVGLGIGLTTPGRMGEAARIVFYPGRRAEALAATAAERFGALTSLAAASLAGAALHFTVFIPFAAGLLASCLGLIFCGGPISRTITALWPGMPKGLTKLIMSLGQFRPSQLILSAGLSFLALALQAGQLTFLLGGGAAYGDILTRFPLSIFVSLIPVGVGGLGLREGALMYLLSGLGLSSAAIVAASLFFYSVYAAPAALAAVLLMVAWRCPTAAEEEI